MKQNSETLVGFFLLGGLALICALIIFYGHLEDQFRPMYIVTVDFPDASQLIAGSDVLLSGAVIGKVVSDPVPVPGKQLVSVVLKIRKSVPLHKAGVNAKGEMIEGDRFVVGSTGLLGDRFVDVKPFEYADGTADSDKAPLIQDNDHIVGNKTSDLQSLTEAVEPLVKKVSDAVTQVTETLKGINSNLLTPQTSEDLKESISRLKDTIKNVNVAVLHADTLIQHTDDTVQNVNDFIDKIKHGDGTVNKLLFDKKMALDIQQLIINMKEHGPVFYSNDFKDKDKK